MRMTSTMLFTLMWIGVCMTGCKTEDTMRKVIAARYEAMNKHDVTALAAYYADSVRAESSGWNADLIGVKAVCQAYGRYFRSSPDLAYRITRVLDHGESIVVEFTSSGTIMNNEPGVPDYMHGKHYQLKNCTIFDFEGGKIVHESTYFDQVSFLRQVGYFGANEVARKN